MIEELSKRPLPTRDLLKAIKATPAAVYTALSSLRQKGRVVTKVDEQGDGERKNFLVN